MGEHHGEDSDAPQHLDVPSATEVFVRAIHPFEYTKGEKWPPRPTRSENKLKKVGPVGLEPTTAAEHQRSRRGVSYSRASCSLPCFRGLFRNEV